MHVFLIPGSEAARQLATCRLFTSGHGIDALSQAVAQYVDTRLCVCRDLLLLLNQRTEHGLNDGDNVSVKYIH